jgi:hypothetical protein
MSEDAMGIGQRVRIRGWMAGIDNPEGEVVGRREETAGVHQGTVGVHLDGDPETLIYSIPAELTEPI